ncbi:MAG: hypothetical protein GYB66_05430 [Chloroflexi bacterium]|nr:hypothetical protein [Chloroflexota bacterium]
MYRLLKITLLLLLMLLVAACGGDGDDDSSDEDNGPDSTDITEESADSETLPILDRFWVVDGDEPAPIHACASEDCEQVDTLEPGTPLNVENTDEGWHTILLDDGSLAYIQVALTSEQVVYGPPTDDEGPPISEPDASPASPQPPDDLSAPPGMPTTDPNATPGPDLDMDAPPGQPTGSGTLPTVVAPPGAGEDDEDNDVPPDLVTPTGPAGPGNAPDDLPPGLPTGVATITPADPNYDPNYPPGVASPPPGGIPTQGPPEDSDPPPGAED